MTQPIFIDISSVKSTLDVQGRLVILTGNASHVDYCILVQQLLNQNAIAVAIRDGETHATTVACKPDTELKLGEGFNF